MLVIVNSLYEIRNEELKIDATERVLWVNPEITEMVTLNVSNVKAWPVHRRVSWLEDKMKEGRCRKLENDPYLPKAIPKEGIEEESLKRRLFLRDEAWDCIKTLVCLEPYIYDEKFRYEQIVELKNKTGRKDKYIYKHLRNYWTFGKNIDALYPSFGACGGVGKPKNPKSGKKMGRKRKTAYVNPLWTGINVDQMIRDIFDAAIAEYYNKRDKHSVRFAWCKMLTEYFNTGYEMKRGVPTPNLKKDHEVPSLDQFRYYLRKKEDKLKIIIAREGEGRYLLKFRPKLSNSTQRALGPGHFFEIDATVADVYLVSSDRIRIIGRPIVYFVIDVYSRLIAGFYVGLEGPSWIGAMMAIDCTVANKVELCAEYGIEINEEQWPAHYLPEFFQADRGEMEGIMSNTLPGIGTHIINTPPYRADLKGIVEQRFRTLNMKIGPYSPGRVKEEYKQRGGKDYVLDAKLTLRAFTKMIIEMILSYNNNQYIKEYPGEKGMLPDQVLPVPIHLWNWGMKNKGGFMVEKPRDFVRFSMLPSARVTVDEFGIHFNKMCFASEELNVKGWFLAGKSHKQNIKYDPRSLNYVFVMDANNQFIPCELLPSFKRFENKSLEEIKMIQFDEDVQGMLYRSEENQAFADLDAQLSKIVDEEVALTEAALRNSGVTDAMRKNEKREARKDEKNDIRQQQAFFPQEVTKKIEAVLNEYEVLDNDPLNLVEEAGSHSSIYEFFNQITEEDDDDETY